MRYLVLWIFAVLILGGCKSYEWQMRDVYVYDAETGQPIVGALVRTGSAIERFKSTKPPEHVATTGKDGRASVPITVPQKVYVEMPGYELDYDKQGADGGTFPLVRRPHVFVYVPESYRGLIVFKTSRRASRSTTSPTATAPDVHVPLLAGQAMQYPVMSPWFRYFIATIDPSGRVYGERPANDHTFDEQSIGLRRVYLNNPFLGYAVFTIGTAKDVHQWIARIRGSSTSLEASEEQLFAAMRLHAYP